MSGQLGQFDLVGQILSVQGRKAGRGTIYDVAFSDGENYSTFKQDIAAKAQSLAGQPVTLRIERVQKGEYVNQNLLDVAPAGSMPALPQAPAPGTTVPAGTPGAPLADIPMKPDYQRELSPGTQRRITFNSAADTAAQLVGGIYAGHGPEAFEDAYDKFKQVTKELEEQSHLRSQANPGATTPPPPVSTPAEVAAAVPGVEVGAPMGDPAQSATPSW